MDFDMSAVLVLGFFGSVLWFMFQRGDKPSRTDRKD